MPEKSCTQDGEHLCHEGFRTDYFGLDHFGDVSDAIEACEAGRAPCERHRCYFWKEKHVVTTLPSTGEEARAAIRAAYAEVQDDAGLTGPERDDLDLDDPWTITKGGRTVEVYYLGEDCYAGVALRGEVFFGEKSLENAIDEAFEPLTVAERAAERDVQRRAGEWWTIRALLGEFDDGYPSDRGPSVYLREERFGTEPDLVAYADALARGEKV